MFKKIILLALILNLFHLGGLGGGGDVFSKTTEGKGIFEIPFDASDAGLSKKIKRTKESVIKEKRNDGADIIQEGILQIVDILTKFMGFFAFLYLVFTGGNLVIKGGTEELAGAKTKIMWTIFALLMTFLIEPLVVNVFFGGGEQKAGEIFSTSGTTAIEAAKIGVLEISGFIGYLEKFVILIALVMMLKSAVQMIFSHSEELKLKEQKDAILWTGVGLIVILLSKTFVYFGVYGNPAEGGDRDAGKVIEEASGILKYILGFVASIAVVMIIYGGIKVVFSQEEDAKEGKEVIKNVIIGTIIISIAFTLVFTLVSGKT